MEQDVKENEVLLLRFKYHSFFDLNPKVRPISNATQFKHRIRIISLKKKKSGDVELEKSEHL